MYEAFFGFRERPFDLSPSPRYLVMTESHREALSSVQYGIASRKGVTLLVGEAGSGKTTVIRAAIESQPERVHSIHSSNPTLSREEFNELVALSFGLSQQARHSKAAMLAELESLLRERLRRGETSVLVVDEAQSMPTSLLEEVRLLANIETDDITLLSIVIAGQPELAERLNQSELSQMKQRIALRCDIRPLAREETLAYVTGRMQTAGGTGSRVFTSDAVALLHSASRGLPRTINVIADNALLGAFAAGSKVVDREMVLEVCRDFDLEPDSLVTGEFFEQVIAPLRVTPPDASVLAGEAPFLPAAKTMAPVPLASWLVDRRLIGYSAAAAMAAVLFAISAIIVGRGAVQPVERAIGGVETQVASATAPTVAAPDTRKLVPPIVRPVVSPAAPGPATTPPETLRADRGAPPSTSAAARTADQSEPLKKSSEIDRIVPPQVAASETLPTLSVAAPSVVGQSDVSMQALLPALAEAAPPASPAAVPGPVASVPGGTAAGTTRAAPSALAEAPIRLVVDRYRLAFGALSASGVDRFWPSVNAKNLQRAFDQIDSQQIEFDSCAISSAGASRAQVSCGGRTTFVPKVGNRAPRVEARRWTFHLSRVDAAWIIDRVESR